MVDPIGGRGPRTPTIRSYGSRVSRSCGARGSIRWTRCTSFPDHARSANVTSAARRGTRQARTLPARRTPAGRLTRYAVGFVRVLLSPGVAAAVSQLPQALYPLAPGFSDRLPPLTDRLRSPCHSQSGQADRWRGAIIGEGDPGGIRSGIAYDLNERPSLSAHAPDRFDHPL